jgi:hypothetical protein
MLKTVVFAAMARPIETTIAADRAGTLRKDRTA